MMAGGVRKDEEGDESGPEFEDAEGTDNFAN